MRYSVFLLLVRPKISMISLEKFSIVVDSLKIEHSVRDLIQLGRGQI